MLYIFAAWASISTISAERTFAFFARKEPESADSIMLLSLISFYLLLFGSPLLIGFGWLVYKLMF